MGYMPPPEPSTGSIVVAWTIIIIMYIGFSALAAFILWGCARRIGKINHATYMNSWGLFWILHVSQLAFNMVFWFIWGLISASMAQGYIDETYAEFDSTYMAIPETLNSIIITSWFYLHPGEVVMLILLVALYMIISIYFAIVITKAFWGSSFKNSAFTHIVPVSIFLGLFIIYAMSLVHFAWTADLVFPEFLGF